MYTCIYIYIYMYVCYYRSVQRVLAIEIEWVVTRPCITPITVRSRPGDTTAHRESARLSSRHSHRTAHTLAHVSPLRLHPPYWTFNLVSYTLISIYIYIYYYVMYVCGQLALCTLFTGSAVRRDTSSRLILRSWIPADTGAYSKPNTPSHLLRETGLVTEGNTTHLHPLVYKIKPQNKAI